MGSGLDVVNVVGSGEFDIELELSVLADDLGEVAEFDPESHTGMHIRLDVGALVTLYRTGSYHIVGVDSVDELAAARKELIVRLQALDVTFTPGEDGFAVRNYVCTGDLLRSVELNALAIGFGLENVEYEPEQFPGLVYRPPEFECVVLIFGSGKAVLTGSTDREVLQQAFDAVADEVHELLGAA